MQTPENVSRRRFIRKLAKGVAVVATLATGGLFVAQNRKNDQPTQLDKTSYDAYPKPEGLSDDILTKGELQKARITVYQTPEVQLYLKRGALDIPIFKDAANLQNNGLTISLIDNDRISWNAASRLPDDARSVWQAVYREKDPKQWSENYWQDLKRYESQE